MSKIGSKTNSPISLIIIKTIHNYRIHRIFKFHRCLICSHVPISEHVNYIDNLWNDFENNTDNNMTNFIASCSHFVVLG